MPLLLNNKTMSTINDKAVLNVIFNPELPATDALLGSDNDNDDQQEGDETKLEGIDELLLNQVKSLEKEAVIAAENGDKDKSLQLITESIKLLPVKASLFNNRAQVYQLLGQTDLAMADLNEAIKLTNGKGSVAMKSFTQRAIINIKLNGFESDNLAAINDLKEGSRLGSDFCKKLLIKFNPYSALCNDMLNTMMKELNGEKIN